MEGIWQNSCGNDMRDLADHCLRVNLRCNGCILRPHWQGCDVIHEGGDALSDPISEHTGTVLGSETTF